MSTQPIGHKEYNYTYRKPKKTQEDVDFPLGPEQSKKRQETPVVPTASVRDHIQALVDKIPRRDGNKLSFLDVKNYRDSFEKDWDARVSGDLLSLGVDMSRKFRLAHDPASGEMLANADHPDKMKIDQYFISTPDMADDFKSGLQLGKLVDTAERKLAPQEMETELTPEAMSWWFDANMDSVSLFSGGGIIFGMGSSAYKGLDLRV